MSIESEGSLPPLDNDQVQKIFRELHERLNISVDFNSRDLNGSQFWAELESDLKRSLGIDSINDIEQGRKNLSLVLKKVLKDEQLPLPELELEKLLDQLIDHFFGFGALGTLLRDDSIYEILINGYQEIYFEKRGKMQRTSLSFWSDTHLQHVINRFCIRNNVDLPSDTNPITKFTLPDNSLVIILFPPVTPNSPALSIRRFVKNPITIDQLIKFGTISAEMLQFLKGAVEAGLNILVCGHLGSGANTLINVLSSFIPGEERVISIENENNFSLRINHLIKLIAKDDLTGEKSFRKLLALAGKMRGDRLVLGEFSFPEAYDALNSINDEFAGSIFRVVARSPADAINRLETFIQLSHPALPVTKIKSLIGSSIDLIAYQERLRDGTRAVKNIVEVFDEIDNNDQVVLKDIYDIEQVGVKDGRILRKFRSYGPPSDKVMNKIETAGIDLPSSIFMSDANTDGTRKLSETERRAIKFSKGKYAFISYSKNDRDQVRVIAKKLENAGFDVWLDVANIKPGEEWTKILENAIKNAGVFLVMLTPSAAKSPFVRNEIVVAQDEKLPIIPVKMEECDIPIQIRALQYILYDKHDVTATVDQISEALSKFISNKRLLGVI